MRKKEIIRLIKNLDENYRKEVQALIDKVFELEEVLCFKNKNVDKFIIEGSGPLETMFCFDNYKSVTVKYLNRAGTKVVCDVIQVPKKHNVFIVDDYILAYGPDAPTTAWYVDYSDELVQLPHEMAITVYLKHLSGEQAESECGCYKECKNCEDTNND